MKTLLLTPAEAEKAASILRSGGLVALPTETVYGLGASALEEEAVKRIFEVKGRPQDNPLIIHVAGSEALSEWCEAVPESAHVLAQRFWPGPLTLVLRCRKTGEPHIPDRVTAGLDTVAVRCPDHPATLEVIRLAGVPVAAPSANLSGKPSTTTALHCFHDLEGKVEAILDGGPCRVGLESTILDLTVTPPRVLRPGGITLEQLREILGEVELDRGLVLPGETPKAPGMKYRHYAPSAELTLVRCGNAEVFRQYAKGVPDEGTAVLCWTGEEDGFPGKQVLAYGRGDEPETLAAHVFAALRELDRPEISRILVRCPEENGVGLAVVNRLKKAAGGKILCL
ncbi:MAG: threonylcarbamoyl-AMP synthase [Oscillospiraceae bacterium]|nr:threonylcarbamoyl-AMP synthase [Oscillospiraceae bacterium]